MHFKMMSAWQQYLITAFSLMLTAASSTAIEIDDFYPFGPEIGDNQLEKADDESRDSVQTITLSSSFEFFSQQFKFIHVLTNGLLSLNRSNVIANFRPETFPTKAGSLIAPFWADVDTRGSGRVYYRNTVNETQLKKMTQDIHHYFDTIFLPEYLFVSTWYRVGYFNRNTDKTNTFQCVLTTNHSTSYVLFLYEEGGIQWAAGDRASSSARTSLAYATVGLNAGNGRNYAIVPGSNTAGIINIFNTSNVGIPGIWVFQANLAEVQDSLVTRSSTNTTHGPAALSVVLILLGLLFLVLLPGALYGCIRVSMSISSEKSHHLKSRMLTEDLTGSTPNA